MALLIWIMTVLLVTTLGGCTNTGISSGGLTFSQEPAIANTAGFLRQYAATRRFSAGQPTRIQVLPDSSAVLFLRSGPRSFEQSLYEFDVQTGEEHLLLSAERLLQGEDENLSPEELARRERMRLSARGITSYQISKDGHRILVPLSGRLFAVDLAKTSTIAERETAVQVKELISDRGFPIDPQFSPDGKKVACVRDGELYVIDIDSGIEIKLTSGANDSITHGLAEFIAQEEMSRFHGFWWSPDSQQIIYQRNDTASLETMHIADATHPDKTPSTWPYPRPGKANVDVTLGVINASGGETVWIDWDHKSFPYLATVRWNENASLTILVQNREQTEEHLLAVDPKTGYTTTLLVEKDAAWLNLDQRMPHWLEDGSGFLWTTERNGSWQLEHRSKDGRLIRSLTSTHFGFKEFLSYDNAHNKAYLLGSSDPTQTHLYSLACPTDGATKITPMTHTPDNHGGIFSKDHRIFVHSHADAKGRREQIVKRIDGSAIGTLRSIAEKPPFTPRVEFTKIGHDPYFHAAIIRPQNYHPGQKYPVIVNVYGGPHAQMVSLSFNRYLLQQWIADHGYIVVSLDGRGTPSRGRAWERVIKGNLIKVPLDDQVAGLKALGRKYPELDLDRVGIFGWSFGGYFSAHAVMQRPDVYHAGVAGAPVADWRDYDTHYTERYMGLPQKNEQGYNDSSVLTYANKLKRPLLLIHGTADDNVYFAHSLKISNALFRAGKQHEFLVLSDFTHMVADPLVTQRLYERIMQFFNANLKPS